jgi:hypothetical protein
MSFSQVSIEAFIEARIAFLEQRIAHLTGRVTRADQILEEMGEPDTQSLSESEDSWDGETEYLIDDSSDEEDDDDRTLEDYTPLDAFIDSDDESDTETVILRWENPFTTPDKNVRGIVIPHNVDQGLEMLG